MGRFVWLGLTLTGNFGPLVCGAKSSRPAHALLPVEAGPSTPLMPEGRLRGLLDQPLENQDSPLELVTHADPVVPVLDRKLGLRIRVARGLQLGQGHG